MIANLNKATIIYAFCLSLAAVLSLAGCSKESSENSPSNPVAHNTTVTSAKPNIVFIFADDQSPKTIGEYGNKEILTPNLDKLAQQGVNFTNAHNMGAWNGAVCQASRAMLNTGRSVWRAHKFDTQLSSADGIEQTWAKMLERQGYDTYMTGKWHVAADAEEVFQVSKHIRPGMPNDNWDHATMEKLYDDFIAGKTSYKTHDEFMPLGYNRPKDENDLEWTPTDTKMGGFYEGGKHWSEVLKDDAIGFIDQAKQKNNPFFMYIAFNAPHDPRQAPQEYQDLYKLDELSLPNNWQDNYPERNDIGNSPSLRDAALAPFPRTEFATKVHLKEYYAIISHLDTQVGEIMAALEASGKMDNTYIIYTADHGLAVGERGLFGKQNMYEESIRAPFIIWGPDIKGGRFVDSNIYLQDVMATSLELAGVDKPEHVFFNSVIDLAKGDSTESHYDAIYGAYIQSQRMIKKDGYKLIVYPDADKIKLYNLNDDPDEVNNLADLTAYQEKKNKLFADLITLQNELGDELDLTSMYKEIVRP